MVSCIFTQHGKSSLLSEDKLLLYLSIIHGDMVIHDLWTKFSQSNFNLKPMYTQLV